MLSGYIAKQYYLTLDVDTDIEARPAGKSIVIIGLADELKKEYQTQLDDIKRKAEELGKREHVVKQEISFAMVSIYEDLELYDSKKMIYRQNIGWNLKRKKWLVFEWKS